MKERPIIFSPSMVRAILDGRKTQTRRIAKIDGYSDNICDGGILSLGYGFSSAYKLRSNGKMTLVDCKYGDIGDRLWVRETWRPEWIFDEDDSVKYRGVRYSDYYNGSIITPDCDINQWKRFHERHCYCSAVCMPRWASRIILEIIDIRVDRLQNITEDDAKSEGVRCEPDEGVDKHGEYYARCSYILGFALFWNRINEKKGYPWQSNPWVWIVEFKVL